MSADPNTILNAARCFLSCVPPGMNNALKTYLLSQVSLTPTCTTPTAPTIVVIGDIIEPKTALDVLLTQPANTGSPICTYTVQYGTTAGGPYTNTKTVNAPGGLIVLTGLTPGTTYYVVATANACAGCSSPNSAEASGTTAPGLSTDLTAYWPMDENAAGANAADATGNGWTAVRNGAWNLNNSFAFLGASGSNGSASYGSRQTGDISTNIDLRAETTAFSVQIWAKGLGGGAFAFAAIVAQAQAVGGLQQWLIRLDPAGTHFEFVTWDSGAVNTTVTSPGIAPDNTWQHLVAGYDGAGKQWLSVNGVRTTTPLAGGQLGVARGLNTMTIDGYNSGSGFGPQSLFLDEAAYWKRSLSQAEVIDLYNAGAGRNYAYVSTH